MVGLVDRVLEVLNIGWGEIILFVLGVILAIVFVPREIKRLERRSNRELVKKLLTEWGADCGQAIVLAMPRSVRNKWLQIKEDGDIVEWSDGVRVNDVIGQVWKDIREGEREPKGSGMLVQKAVYEVMYSDDEKKGKKTLAESDPKYQLEDPFGRERELPTAVIRSILNTIHAKVDIFDRRLLPVRELEGVIGHLEFFRAKDEVLRSQFILYAAKLARSMEMFGEYLWKLENRSTKSKEGGATYSIV